MNKREILQILNQLNIAQKKSWGQNFLIDANIKDKIIRISEISVNDVILEVGTGLGFLTESLINFAKKVYSFEIDPHLYKYLKDKFSIYTNVEIINQNILETELPYHSKIVSSLPFSATGPILEKLFYNENPPLGILIIEKKIANRLSPKSIYKNTSRITISFNAFMEVLKEVQISSNCFYPIPNIDISLIKISPRKNINKFLLDLKNRKYFLEIISGIMPYKNKNIVNALATYFKKKNILTLDKNLIQDILNKANFGNSKLVSFKVDDLISIVELLHNFNRNTFCD